MFARLDKNKHKVALCGSLLGILFILLGLLGMNGLEGMKRNKGASKVSSFEISQTKKKKKTVKKIAAKPKKRKRAKVAPPSLANALSGSSFGLGQFEFLAEAGSGLLGNSKNVIMTEDTVDVIPKARYRPPFNYPSYARKRSIEGYVTLNMLIGTNGEVEQVKLLNAEPAGVFDQTALESAQEWQFEAASYQGQKVKVWVKQRIAFNLN